MPTPVEVSFIKRAGDRVEGFGGIFRDRPWYLSVPTMIREAELPDAERYWNFYVRIAGMPAPVAVASTNGRKYLAVRGMPCATLGLPEWQPGQPIPA
jgi:hypothetical protein